MALVLAIEPDPRQAERLQDVLERRVRAELVHGATTERALAAIGTRVPDLVLVPPLLSAEEDAAVAGALRIIAAAANVRMLTTPLLADPEQPPEARGLLARWRRRGARAATGCDPAVFAEQIAAYLAEARQADDDSAPLVADADEIASGDERTPENASAPDAPTVPVVDATAAAESVSQHGEAPPPAPAVHHESTFVHDLSDAHTLAAVAEPEGEWASAAADETHQPVLEAAGSLDDTPVLALVPVAPASVAGETNATAPVSDAMELALVEPVVTEAVHEAEVVLDEPPAVPAAGAADFGVDARTVEELIAPLLQEIVTSRATAPAPDPEDEPSGDESMRASEPAPLVPPVMVAVAECELPVVTPEPAPLVEPPSLVVVRPEATVAAAVTDDDPLFFVDDASPEAAVTALAAAAASAPAAPVAEAVAVVPAPEPSAPDRPAWVELIESLREDLQRLRTERDAERHSPPAVVTDRRPMTVVALPDRPRERRRRRSAAPRIPVAPAARRPRATRPVQDQWGFFDPEQCGFAALLAKLDEISASEEANG